MGIRNKIFWFIYKQTCFGIKNFVRNANDDRNQISFSTYKDTQRSDWNVNLIYIKEKYRIIEIPISISFDIYLSFGV